VGFNTSIEFTNGLAKIKRKMQQAQRLGQLKPINRRKETKNKKVQYPFVQSNSKSSEKKPILKITSDTLQLQKSAWRI